MKERYLYLFSWGSLVKQNIMSQPPSKRHRVELTLEDKLNVIKESEMVPKPTLKVIYKNRCFFLFTIYSRNDF